MPNIAMIIEYDGSSYYGFQKQPQANIKTIQGVLELAIFSFTNEPISVIASGRTDAKVHASYQVINFTTNLIRPLHAWLRGVNNFLPPDIVICEVVVAPDNFNARFDAKSRTYHYYLLNSPVKSAILSGKVGWYPKALDFIKISEAMEHLLGTHDFSCFRASLCQANSAIKTMIESKLVIHKDIACFIFKANAFLYHMVRNMVGALIYVGLNKISVNDCINLLVQKDRTKALPT
ncbi:MAG: tRNA pseudouridine(38-40) synthase TruA, partial [Bacteroidia bacterium]